MWEKRNKSEDLKNYKSGIICNVTVEDANPSLLEIVKLERFSKLGKLVRVTALVLKFIAICKGEHRKGGITLEENNKAYHSLVTAVQQSHYGDEIRFLLMSSRTKCPSIVKQLGLFIDEQGLIRCRGRIEHTQLAFDAKFPTLLPKDSRLTSLIVVATHSKVLHNGVGGYLD